VIGQHYREAKGRGLELRGKIRQQDLRMVAKQAPQELHALTPGRQQFRHPLELLDAKRRQQVRHFPVQPEDDVMKWFVLAIAANHPRLLRGGLIAGPEHSALTGSDELVAIERKGGGRAKSPDDLAVPARAEALRTIFNQVNRMAAGKLGQCRNISSVAVEM